MGCFGPDLEVYEDGKEVYTLGEHLCYKCIKDCFECDYHQQEMYVTPKTRLKLVGFSEYGYVCYAVLRPTEDDKRRLVVYNLTSWGGKAKASQNSDDYLVLDEKGDIQFVKSTRAVLLYKLADSGQTCRNVYSNTNKKFTKVNLFS